MKYQILHHNHDEVQIHFKENKYQLTSDNQETKLLVVGSTTILKENVLKKYPSLKYLVVTCNGLNNIDQEYCKNNNIKIFNSPTANINATAEHTAALILASLRNILPSDKSIRRGKWERKLFIGTEIRENNVGFIGFGRIARLVCQKLESFSPKNIYAYDPFLTQEQIDQVNSTSLKVNKVELNELLSKSTIISLHLPLLPKTKHLISKDQFNLMQKETIIVNCSRGGIIDETELIEALTTNKIKAAALDVFENEPEVNPDLFKLPNCILTPHLASMTAKAQESMITQAKESFEKYLQAQKN